MSGFFQNMSIDGELETTKSDVHPGDNEESSKKVKVKLSNKVFRPYHHAIILFKSQSRDPFHSRGLSLIMDRPKSNLVSFIIFFISFEELISFLRFF
jgi:hypothetical protein